VRSPFCAGETVEWNLKHAMRVTGVSLDERMIDDEEKIRKEELDMKIDRETVVELA
jgi:hypothetical protein